MSWDIELAKEFKIRDNNIPYGAIIGEVITPLPNLKISILDGNVILENDKLYITQNLKEKEFLFEIYAGENVGNITLRNVGSINYDIINLQIDNKNFSKIILTFELKSKDKVLLMPTADQQRYFIIDKIESLGGA